MILACLCKSEYQDRRYGKGLRVHNHAPRGNMSPKHPEDNRFRKGPGWRCTVCGITKRD